MGTIPCYKKHIPARDSDHCLKDALKLTGAVGRAERGAIIEGNESTMFYRVVWLPI